ncbi:MAG: Bug family tripartite tricarboxylate transporter substrate binding protein [Kiloniellaceae bacterium]
MRKGFIASLLAGAAVVGALAATPLGPAKAAELPCSTAKLIVPWSPGGGTDVVFRIIAEAANKAGAEPQLQVVNISGQGGNKGAKEAVKAKPDGCTLFAIHQSAMTSYFTGRVDFSFEAFEPVALLTRTPPIIGAHPDVPFNNVKDLVAAAKASPGTILTGATLGSTSHFWSLLLEDAADIKLKYVPYDGTRQRMTALLAKNIDLGEINLAATVKYIENNDLKALGIFTPEREPQIPDVPTLKEQGIDLVGGTDRGIVAPKGTPKAVVAQWGEVLQKAVQDPQVVASLAKKGTSIIYKAGDEYRKYIDETFAKWKEVAQKVGVYKRTD